MANTGIRQLTTVVGGYAKRIWYSLNGTTPTAELMSIDDAGKLKSVSQQIAGLAGTGNRMVLADSTGNLSAGTTIGTGGISGSVYSGNSTSSSFVFKINAFNSTNIVRFYISQQGGDASLSPRIIEIYGFFEDFSQRWHKISTTRIVQAGDAGLASLAVSIDTSVSNKVTITLSNATTFYATAEYSNLIAG